MKRAYVNWNAGVCRVIDVSSSRIVCQSQSFRRATRRARNLGYSVRVYTSHGQAPRDAVDRSLGSYVLPRAR